MTSFRLLAVAMALACFCASLSTSALAATPKVPDAVGKAMQDRDYEAALKAIEAAATEKDAAQDYLAYLKGRAFHLAKRYDDAVAAFEALDKKFPKSEWGRRARFAKGVSLARKGDFLKAEEVYRAEAEYLLSADRKQELADIYLEFADAFFKPAKEDVPPDYAKAREFYEHALEVGPKPEKQIEIELLIAQCYQNLKQHNDAIDRYQKFIAAHAGHAREVEARFRLGESQLASGDAVEARRTWQDLLALFKDAISDRLAEAAYNIALTYDIPEPNDKEQLDLGVAALKTFAEKYPEHKLVPQAQLSIAQSYFNIDRHEEAVASLKRFLADARFAKSDKAPEARKLLGDAYKEQGKFDDALAAWGEFLAKHPTDMAWSEVQQALVDTEFDKAHAQFVDKKYAKAREFWTAFLARYPLDERGPTILYRFGQMSYVEEKWEAALADWRRLVSKHPGTEQASQAQFMIGLVHEKKLTKLDEALKEYKKTTWGSFVARAQQRIARLTGKELQIATERIFRSDETPRIKLTTRNIDAVTVRIYSVDLETYFRKMHFSQGIDKLDIALIDPDATFEYQVPKYQEYQKFEEQVEVSLPKIGDAKGAEAGVLAVTVSSKTLEATTLVLQSDLDMIVKTSRDELFVFAQDLRTGKPWPKARVLVSDGTKVFAEGVTGEDGVLQKSFPELKSAESARVLALSGRHAAANVVALEFTGLAQRGGARNVGSVSHGLTGLGGAHPKILAALNSPTTLKFVETPLKDVIAYLRGVHGIEIQIDTKALDGVGVSSDTPVTRNLKGISLRSALRLMLKELELSFTINNDVLLITTPEVADTAGQAGQGVAEFAGANPKILAALNDQTTLEFVETPLHDVIDYLKDLHGIEIQIDTKALDGVGISSDTPVTRNLKGVSLRSALRLMLKELELTFMISDEVLLITTPEVADNAPLAQGLSAKGYIYTDRPAYRAGQTVYVRGILRKVSGDAYFIEKNAKYRVDVFDNRNRLVSDSEVSLNDFGSFHANFQLPAESPPGIYRILVHDADDKENYQGGFVVQGYQLEPVRIDVEATRNVYYRGEEIEGKIKVAFYYGAPLAGREVRYTLAGGRVVTAQTDDQGEVAFKLPTREFSETQLLDFTVVLPERNLTTTKNFVLATQGFGLKVQTVRPVYLAGESFEITVKAIDAEGKPLAQAVSLSIYEHTVVDGKAGEVLSSKHELKTAKDGLARHTSRLEKGAEYVLRAEGIDRFTNPVSAQSVVSISDDKDATRLRILADRHTYKVGDTASVQLHWREAPALALVTFQGAKILEYKLVNLQTGANKLAIPMTAKLAPNFELSVAVMTDPRSAKAKPGEQQTTPPVRFHEATSPFAVERDLKIKIDVKKRGDAKTPPQPGDDIDVTITATDPQGKPAKAEVSLALVEQALLARFAPNAEPIGEFFSAGRRESAVRTNSSVTFSYTPHTRPISAQLLAEKDRLEVKEDEARRLAEIRKQGELPAGLPALPETDEALAGERRAQVPFVTTIIPVADLAIGIDPFGSNGNGIASGQRQKPKGQMMGGMGGMGGGMGMGGMIGGMPGRSAGKPYSEATVWHNRRGGARASADFDTLIDLITQSIAPTSWKDAGGAGAIAEFRGNLALVVSQTHDVHEQVKPLPDLPVQETAYWNPIIATDDKGQAVITITLPERSTAWNLHAKGITVETLAGEASAELAVKKDLFGELKLPAAFTDGDSAQIVASVHNAALDKGPIKVVLKTTLGGKSVTETKAIDVKKKGIEELVFSQKIEIPADAPRVGSPGAVAHFELTISAGERRDVLRRTVPVRPYGTSVFAISGGTASGDALAVVEQPAGMKLESPRLQIVLGPTVEQSLLDVLLAPAGACQVESRRIAAGAETAASDLMAALALQGLLGATRDAGTPQASALDARVRSSISLLVSLQNDDGGWSWAGAKGGSDRYNSARVVWALALAKGVGYRVGDEIHGKGLAYLQVQLGQSAVIDYETKTVLLQSLASAGQGDFTLANQLYRNRAALSPPALAHLALAFAEMDRKQTAGELLDLLAKQNLDESPKRASGVLSWTHGQAELRAIYALTLDKAVPADARLKEQVDWLMAHRTGHRWIPEKATGPAMLALCHWFSRTRFKGEHYKLSVFVNDLLAKELDVTEETTTQTIDVPAKLLTPKLSEGEKQRIRFVLTGRGRFTYQCILGGFVAAEKLKSTTPDWSVARFYTPALLELDGQSVPRGFDVLTGSYSPFRNDLTQLPVGQRGEVSLEIKRHNVAADAPPAQLEYLVVTEPLPAGVAVVESSIKGDFARFEVLPGEITFYVGNHRGSANISYEIHGYLPGSYRAAPAIVRNTYRPDQLAVSLPQALAVLPLGAKSGDKYRLSPRELFELGKRHFDKGQFEQAAPHLSEAFSAWNLAPNFYRDTVRMLLETRLKIGPPAEVVRFFEIILEKYPDLVISFENYLKIGAAYHKIGEYERGYLVYRATVEASFLRESFVAGSLQSQGQFLRSVDLMSRLLQEYPPEGYVASATYALAQRVYAKAPEAAADARLREAKVNRVDLIRRALAMLDNFLTSFPDDPAADQASFSLANALLDVDAHSEAIAACQRYAARYAQSDYLDSYWYIIGYCHYACGEHKQALEMCGKVAQAKRNEKSTGRRVDSPNKWQAIYILGQIHDSLGQAAAAIREYERVKDRFEDARAAIAYFSRKEISLPEVTTVKPGDAAGVELKFRNVAGCEATVYRIDLMKFSLLRRSLGDIANINLSGIRPFHEAKVKLGDGQDYRDRTAKLEFPLKDEGAYLVVCRGDDLYTSGLVLVTPLVVETLEETESGRVRATVRDRVKDQCVHDVHVKVIGTRNADFTSGETDLRGVFVADSIRGKSMVIAQAKGGRYAFFRGGSELGPPPEPVAASKSPESKPLSGKAGGGKDSLLDALKGNNRLLQQEQEKNLHELQHGRGMGGMGGGMGGFGTGGFF